jgi:hypothetical protein
MLSELFQYLSQMEKMVLYCTAVNENVVEVKNDETIQVYMGDIVHEGHECGRGVD